MPRRFHPGSEPCRSKQRKMSLPSSSGERNSSPIPAAPVRTRGGTGQIMEIGTKGDLEFSVNASFDRIAHAPKGRDGGQDGARGVVKQKSGVTLRTKGYQVIPDGERLILELPGGAGMGDPRTRDPESVARDVRDGLVSLENARSIYRVATRPRTASRIGPPRMHCVS